MQTLRFRGLITKESDLKFNGKSEAGCIEVQFEDDRLWINVNGQSFIRVTNVPEMYAAEMFRNMQNKVKRINSKAKKKRV